MVFAPLCLGGRSCVGRLLVPSFPVSVVGHFLELVGGDTRRMFRACASGGAERHTNERIMCSREAPLRFPLLPAGEAACKL